MRRLLTVILLISILVLSSCSRSNAEYVDNIVGVWHTKSTLDESVERQYVFHDDFTGEYTFFAYTILEGSKDEYKLEEQKGEFSWSYDENAKCYLIYILTSTPQVARISTEKDALEINIDSFHIGTKTK